MNLPMPAGWPWSLWFFAATMVVYLLQRFPPTGIFLMFLLAAFWSVILINLGVIGVGLEALTGRVSRLWLLVPLLYFGGYYVAYAKDQATIALLRAQYSSHNDDKSLPFDAKRQDLVFEKGKGDFHPAPFSFVQDYGLKRAFDAAGQVHFMGTSDACATVRKNDVYRSAGVYSFGFFSDGSINQRRMVKDFCSIYAPAKPDKPVIRVTSNEVLSTSAAMAVRKQSLRLRDETSGGEIEIRTGSASPLKPFPMLAMGCGLNSGAPSWDCFIGFLRGSFVPLGSAGLREGYGTALVAKALGLSRSQDYAAVASGSEAVQAWGDAADAMLVRKELAILERMLADPTKDMRDGWFYHLPNRPSVIAPYSKRIFGALGMLQNSTVGGSETGRNLWRLAAALPEDALAPHRAELTDWLHPGNARPWTEQTNEIYARLDVADPAAREIVLSRLETQRGDLQISLLPPFCRMGLDAPKDVKQRLLALWRQRGEQVAGTTRERSNLDTMLYVTLARMGLKSAAGKVEQRYYGPTFAAIWDQVTPETPVDICSDSLNDLGNRFRKR